MLGTRRFNVTCSRCCWSDRRNKRRHCRKRFHKLKLKDSAEIQTSVSPARLRQFQSADAELNMISYQVIWAKISCAAGSIKVSSVSSSRGRQHDRLLVHIRTCFWFKCCFLDERLLEDALISTSLMFLCAADWRCCYSFGFRPALPHGGFHRNRCGDDVVSAWPAVWGFLPPSWLWLWLRSDSHPRQKQDSGPDWEHWLLQGLRLGQTAGSSC